MWCAVLLDALASPLNGVLLLTAAGPAATAFLTEEEGSCSSLLADALRSPAQTLLLNSFRSDPQAVSLASVGRAGGRPVWAVEQCRGDAAPRVRIAPSPGGSFGE